jgi:transcriptional regulator GlxA family with amidase domain
MGTSAVIQGIRVQRARTLLLTSRMSIEQVALAVGYRDSTALRRLMRKAVGATPGRVRATAAVTGEALRRPRAATARGAMT